MAFASWAGGLSVVGTNRVDVGMVKDYEFTNAIFTVRNSGSAPVSIKRLVPTCSCLKARIGRGDLAPGETAQIALGLSGMLAVPGDFNHGVWVHGEDGPILKLSLTGTVVPLFTGLSATAAVFEVPSAEPAVFTNRNHVAATEPGVALGSAQVSASGIRVDVAVATNAGECVSYEIETVLTMQGGPDEGAKRANVVFPVIGKDGVETKPVEFSFSISQGGDLKVVPQRLVVRGNEPCRLVVSRGKRVLKTSQLRWEPQLEGLTVSAQPSRLSGGLVVTVTADATAAGKLSGAGALRFSYPGCKAVEVVIAAE
jgi:hypothetical protein